MATSAQEMSCNRSICHMVHLDSNASSSVQLSCVTPLNTSSISMHVCVFMGCPRWLSGKEPHCQCRRHKRRGFDPWVGKIPWRKWQPTAVLLPGESYGQRSLAGHSSWGHNELDVTEHTRSPVIVYKRSFVMCLYMYVSISPYKCKHTHLYSIYMRCVYIYLKMKIKRYGFYH